MNALSREQVRSIDRLAIEKYGIPGVVLMENAGRSAASFILQTVLAQDLQIPPQSARVGILCGGGNNGGDGYVIARHLHNAGVKVMLFAATPLEKLNGDAAVNATTIQRMELRIRPISNPAELASADAELLRQQILVDALLGTGFHGAVRAELAAVIERCNALAARGARIVAIDVPSGLDCDTGAPSNATIRAHYTVTFVDLKRGFLVPDALPFIGRVAVGDIGAPKELIEEAARNV